MSEPDGGGVVQDGKYDGLECGHQGIGCEAPARASMTLRALKARSTQVDRWVSSVTPRILGVLFNGAPSSPIRTCGWSLDWWVTEGNSVKLDFWAAMVSCFP